MTVAHFPASGITQSQAAALQRAGGYPPASGAWMTQANTTVVVPAADTLYLYWFPIYRPILVTLLRTRCTVGGAGSAVKFALWRTNPATGRPLGVPFIGQNAGLSTATSGTFQDSVVASVATDAAGVWFGSKYTGTLPTMIANLTGGSNLAGISYPAGTMPGDPRGNFSFADAYANDIMALDLTSASLTPIIASVPAFALEWA